jgi:hypothetical protein
LKTSPTYKTAVVDLQCLLNQKNAAKLAVDGIFGSKTKEAVLAWQFKKGLDMDGIVGSNTWNSLCGPIVSGLLAKKLVVLANKEVGVKEVPLYSNRGPRVDQYRAATSLALGKDGWFWCAAFICWLMREAMAEGEYGFSRPQEAGVFNFEKKWAVKQKCGIRPKVTGSPFFSTFFFLSPISVFFSEKVNPRRLQLNFFFFFPHV